MGTLMGLMSLSRLALDADQTAINTTANNVANESTAGYTREVVTFAASDAVSLSGQQGLGEGVSATVSSVRDRVLDQMLQQQTQTTSQSSTQLSALQSLQSLFGLSASSTNASSTTMGSALDGFFSSLTSLASNPSNAAAQTAVLTAASTLAAAFNSTAQGLNSQTSQLNQGIATSAQQVNGLTSSIAQLNQQISSLSPTADAGALEDQRQQDILQLSGIVGVNQITTENNGVTLTTSSGAVLVSGTQSYALSTTNVNGNTQLVGGTPPATMSDIQGGSIGGMMQARDQNIPAMLSTMDQLANTIGTAINTQNQQGLTSTGAAGGAIFSLPSTTAGSAAGISVIATGTSAIATAGAGEGASGTTNALALANLATNPIVGGQTASSFYSSFIGQIGDTVASTTSSNTAQTAALNQVQTQVNSLSGVSFDDEASNLTLYQKSYEAAAKVMTIVDQLMSDALNLGQQTTVS